MDKFKYFNKVMFNFKVMNLKKNNYLLVAKFGKNNRYKLWEDLMK